MPTGTAAGPSIRRGTSVSRDAQRAAAELHGALFQPGIKLALFYCAADYDLPRLAQELHQRFGEVPLIGCTTAGEITPQGYLTGALTGVSIASGELDAAVRLMPLDPFESSAAARCVSELRPPAPAGHRAGRRIGGRRCAF